MSRYRIKVAMSQNGRSSRDNHSVVLQASANGAFNANNATALSIALGGALAAVLFNTTNIMRVTFSELDNAGKAVKNGSQSFPLALVGHNVFADGDGGANEHICLAIEKAGIGPKAGITLLRHVVSADEYAAYLNDGTVPPRFAVSPAGTYNAGHPLGDNILKAFNDNGFTLELPPLKINNVLTSRPVTRIAAQDFRSVKATKKRRSAASQIAKGVQREMNAAARAAWKLWNRFVEGQRPADIVSAVRDIVTAAWAAYNALVAAERILVSPPTFPALPAP